MDDNEVIIYGFRLGNSDPDFQEFVKSMSNEEVHNLRKILYQSKIEPYNDGIGAAMYGRDRYGSVAIPESIKKTKWKESENELFSFIKDLWVASVLGYTNPGINPIKMHQWKITRIRATTSREEGWAFFKSTAIELALAYISIKGTYSTAKFVGNKLSKVDRSLLFHRTMNQSEYYIPPLKVYAKPLKYKGKTTGFSISGKPGWGAQKRLDYHRLGKASKASNKISPVHDKKLLHYHRGKGNDLERHRPWEKGHNDKYFWNRF